MKNYTQEEFAEWQEVHAEWREITREEAEVMFDNAIKSRNTHAHYFLTMMESIESFRQMMTCEGLGIAGKFAEQLARDVAEMLEKKQSELQLIYIRWQVGCDEVSRIEDAWDYNQDNKIGSIFA